MSLNLSMIKEKSTPGAPNLQHLNSPKKCCTLGALGVYGPLAENIRSFDEK